MPDSEFARYGAFVDRTMTEVKKGLELDNHGAGSRKRRVHEALSVCDASDGAASRSPAQKVIDGRFILGGDDASYLANGLALLWSTVGHSDEQHNELGLAPAALYSPDAVNGIRRGLLAAFETKNEELRKDAHNQIANLMRALVPILEFLYGQGDDEVEKREAMRTFLMTGKVTRVGDRNTLFRFLMRTKSAIDNQDGPDGKDIPSSSLAFQILRKATKAHEEAMETEKRRLRECKNIVNEKAAKINTLLWEKVVAVARVAQLNRQMTKATEEIGTLTIAKEAERAALQQKLEAAQAQAQVAAERAQVAAARAQEVGPEQARKITRLEREVDELTLECNQAELAAASLLEEKAEQAKELEDEKTELRKTVNAMQERVEDLQNQAREAGASSNARLAEMSDQFDAQCAQLTSETNGLREMVQLLTTESETRQDELKRSNDALNDAQVHTVASEMRTTKLGEQLHECNTLLEETRRKVGSLESRIDELITQWRNSVEASRSERSKLAEKTTKLARWVTQLADANASNVELDDAWRDYDAARLENEWLVDSENRILLFLESLTVLLPDYEDYDPASRPPAADGGGADSYIPYIDNNEGTVPAVAADSTNAPAAGDAWVDAAVYRGLVGQRGPTEPADVAHCPQDALLPYALPKIDEVVERLLPARLLLESTADPTGEEVDRATAALRSCPRADGAKRQRVDDPVSPAVVSEALALFQDDFAITGTTPAAELPPERCGVELPHEARWMPQGPRGAAMARVAVLEHAVARCGQLAARDGLRPSVAASLRHAATALKLQQLAPLYELHEAIERDDDPHPLGTGAARLVTRPCAVVRGTLSFPSRPGVAPLVERGGSAMPLTQDASLAQAMGKTAAATATLRNGLRREGRASNVYVAPEAHELAFRSAPTRTGVGVGANDPEATGAAADAAAGAAVTDDRVPSSAYRDETFRRIVNRLLVAASALDVDEGEEVEGGHRAPDPVAAFLDVAKATIGGAGAATPQSRREGLWAEMQRHVAVSQDRLWVFVRLMSGKVGGNASEVITLADEATLKASKAIQEQRSEIAKRVSDMQSRIVETVVSSMLKNSKMTMEYKESSLAVIDAEARKNLKDLESGASGRPFFEANVALKNLSEAKEEPPALKDVLSGLANVAEQMHATLERTLAQPSAASASLVELSHPANSYFVTMRGDALAAIRAAQEMLNCELGVLGCGRRLATWELVEGGCAVLTARFAELCGYLLVQARTSTGVSAMYVSHQNLYTNASQARVALARLTTAARAYLARVAPPMFDSETPKEARFLALTQGEQVRDIDVAHRQSALPRAPLTAPIPANGWYQYGGFRRWS